MANRSAREVACKALVAWRRNRAFADAILHQELLETRLSPSDRGFATELFYGVLRNLTLLDFIIGEVRDGLLDATSRDLLRLGLYQIFRLATPAHAAVFETVALAQRRNRAVVNGVLRAAIRRKDEVQRSLDHQPLAVRKSHPPFLIERWSRNFGETAAQALCEWNNLPPPIYARVNELKTSRAAFLSKQGDNAQEERTPGFVRLSNLPSEALQRGECYIQDPSTAMACQLLAPQPGERILDACAAPGGKTAFLAEMMQNRGQIVACDRDAPRLTTLQANAARLGLEIVAAVAQDWSLPVGVTSGSSLTPPFDRILVDAPCSNTGVMRRRVDVRWRLTASDFDRTQAAQLMILRNVIPLLKPDGVLVYSTCSLEPEENEKVSEIVTTEHPFLHLEEQRALRPFRDAIDGAFAVKFRRC